MIETQQNTRQSRSHRYCAFICKHSVQLIASVILPLLLPAFTVFITLDQRHLGEQQRPEDRRLADEQREQDLNISRQQRLEDQKTAQEQRRQDLNISFVRLTHDQEVAHKKLDADNSIPSGTGTNLN